MILHRRPLVRDNVRGRDGSDGEKKPPTEA
jgi:hypothetical protein